MPLQFETVAIPITQGIDLKTAERLIQPPALLEAVNARFNGNGSEKRSGHVVSRLRAGTYPANTSRPVLTTPELTPYGAKVLDTNWLYGWGTMTSATRAVDTEADLLAVSPYPEPGLVFGGFERDSELVAWTGHSLISFSPSNPSGYEGPAVNAVIPHINTSPIAKTASAQVLPDIADNGSQRFVCWMDTNATNTTLKYSVYDSVTGAVLVNARTLSSTAYAPRVVNLGKWFHLAFINTDDDSLDMLSFSPQTLSNPASRSLGSCVSHYFDIWKVDETRAVVLVNDDGIDLQIEWIGTDGQSPSDEAAVTITLGENVINECSIAVHPTTERFGIAYIMHDELSTNNNFIKAGVFNRDGTIVDTLVQMAGSFGNYPDMNAITIAPKYMLGSTNGELFDIYASLIDDETEFGLSPALRTRYWRIDTTTELATNSTVWMHLVSHAFRVGDRTFVWAGWGSTLQNTYILLDETLKPVGKALWGVGNAPPVSDNPANQLYLASVNYQLYNTQKDQMVFHLGVAYKQRVATDDDQTGLFTETSIQFIKMDFLHPLRSTQAGRATYLSGAQVTGYDGAELVEAGFHIGPEFTLTPQTLGSLTANGTYSYRIDLCYKNAQNEEVRSHSYIEQVTLASQGSDPAVDEQQITLYIKNCPTRRDGAYFLIFRNTMVSGAPTSTWNLLNSRDPNSPYYLPNDPTVPYVDFTDDGTIFDDTEILSNELHPGNSPLYQHPFAPPACEIIAAGKDRVWVAGGELPYGSLAPSRLFNPNETPTWNGNLVQQIDRNEAPITGIGFVGDLAVVFRERYTYILEGDGTDNSSQGYWPPARLALADMGCRGPESILLTTAGLFFQSPAGLRLLGAGGQLSNLGESVDPISRGFEISDTVIVPTFNEARWYGPTGAIVFNYGTGAWSTWTCPAVASLRGTFDQGAVLLQTTGELWTETEGTYLDGDRSYTHKIRFPWLHAGDLGDFQRVRRFSAMGYWDPEEPHSVRAEIYYDEREFPQEIWEWDVPDATQNTDTWGAATWGAGGWGDTGSTLWIRDSVWRWRRRPRRQKCSVFSIVISDNNTAGPGFTLVALGLELGKKQGLDRTAVPGGTNRISR